MLLLRLSIILLVIMELVIRISSPLFKNQDLEGFALNTPTSFLKKRSKKLYI